ncbi:MAG: hypothetical protein COS34_10985 [Lysobacterales bacterium CG02_land_8_20_14_3_00_62_12]|nr:MAG: hypothetical protein COS34_10985 [Xanthomonadales bacterium CG02_land_8_20_14_3_00_62_12]
MPFTEQEQVAVALVYQSPALNEHVRNALGEFGARLVYESATQNFQLEALEGSGASVVVVNLDPDVEEDMEQIDQLLFDEKRKVIFNDGEVTSKLSGWDQARWARHLVAKILGRPNLLPARPVGSEAVPVREMPQHGLDSVYLPPSVQAPVVSAAAEEAASREMTAAMAAFSVDDTLASQHQTARNELEAALQDFGFFAEPTAATEQAPAPDPVDSPAPAAPSPLAATVPENHSDDVFSGLDLDRDSSTTHDTASSPFAALFGDPPMAPAVASQAPPSKPAEAFDFAGFDAAADLNVTTDAGDEITAVAGDEALGLDEFLSQHALDTDATANASPPQAKAQQAADDDFLAGLSFDLDEPEPAATAAVVPAPLPKAKPALSSRSGAPTPVDKVTAVAAAEAAEGLSLADLGALALLPIEVDTPTAVASSPVLPTAAAPVASVASVEDPLAKMFADFSFELEAIEEPTTVAAQPEAYVNPFADIAAAVQEPAKAARAAPASKPSAGAKPNAAGLRRVWVLGASIGGPDAVREFLGGIPASSGNLFLLAQHMGADFVELMVTQLVRATGLQVKMAANAEPAAPGQVLIVPLADRLLVDTDGAVTLVTPAASSPYSPSIDQVLFDVADRFGSSAGAIIFSGMAHDAIEGAKYLASKGGVVWAQDPATCVVSSMIDGVIEAGIAQLVASPAELAARFVAEFP